MSDSTYTARSFPAFRQLVIDGMEIASKKHWIHGLIEVDVTKARRRLGEIKEETGKGLSFTGFIIYCCAKAVDENKDVHAYRDWLNRLIVFDDVDVSIPVERSTKGKIEVLQLIIRGANRKSFAAIHQEIRQAQSQEVEDSALLRYIRWYVAIPAFVRHFFQRILHRIPQTVKKLSGTIMVTSIGMFGRGAGWGVPLPGHTLTITIGGIVPRPVVRDTQLENREHLCLTASFDHDIVDGAPAARFIQCFKDLVESGSGLFEEI
jgi:pyruvate/2-oxoglutarate dehydrogenase complex dihydrolipoamide acyltransferase (E2) component